MVNAAERSEVQEQAKMANKAEEPQMGKVPEVAVVPSAKAEKANTTGNSQLAQLWILGHVL